MKGFLFLLLTISLLFVIQIQTGVLGNKANDTINLSSSATAPALSSLSGGTVLLFLMNTLIHLFHLC